MSTRRIPSLDGLRAISISLVLLGHLSKWGHISLRVPPFLAALGVHVFFVLSGYLITRLLLREYARSSTISLRDFYVRRAFRIFPAALVFLGFVGFLYWREMSWYHLGAAVFYVANMDETRPWIFGHLWSLGIEEQFYLLWPWVVKKWHRHRATILVGVSIATPVFHTVLFACKAHGGILGSLPAYADQLAIGCLLAVFESRLPKLNRYVGLGMALAAVIIPLYPGDTRMRTLLVLFVLQPLMNVCLAGLVLHVIQHPYRVLNWAPVSWLGKISYSLYLWQELFCTNNSIPLGSVLVLPALACAAASYYLVEQPMLRVRDRITQRRVVSTVLRLTTVPGTDRTGDHGPPVENIRSAV